MHLGALLGSSDGIPNFFIVRKRAIMQLCVNESNLLDFMNSIMEFVNSLTVTLVVGNCGSTGLS